MTTFTVKIQNGAVVIDDGQTQGGDVAGETGEFLKWVADRATVGRFSIRFFRLKRAGGSLRPVPAWPFTATGSSPAPATAIAVETATVTDVVEFWGWLANLKKPHRYVLEAYPKDVDENQEPIETNPVIIVED